MSTIRFSGMASNMDTESMVKQLMQVERMRADKYTQTRQVALWRQEQYNEVNKAYANFILDVSKEFGVTRRSTGSMIQNTSSLDWVKKAVSSNENVVTAKSTTDAPVGTHRIKVENLAEGISGASTDSIGLKKSDTLSALGVADGQITFDVEGKEVIVDFKATDTIDSLVQKINNPIDHDNDPSTKEVALGIQASFDDTTGRLFLSSKGTGKNARIHIKEDTEQLFTGANKFKLNVTAFDVNGDPIAKGPIVQGTEVYGKNAKIYFDGAENLEFESNQFTINGIEINLKKADNIEYTIGVDTDVDGVYDKIKSFVEKYNDLIDQMNKKTVEKKYRSYQPLTKEQKEAMKENDIKLWEEKAKSGLLRGDEFINRTTQTMRSGLYETVYDTYDPNKSVVENKENKLSGFNQLHQIGITTGEWKDKGKLAINEEKLKKAIKEDVNGVMELLFKPSSVKASDSELAENKALRDQKRKESGILNRLFDDVVIGMKEIVKKAGPGENSSLYRSVKSNLLIDFVTKGGAGKGSISLLDEDVFDMDKRITREENRLIGVENRYWQKFTAMEKAMSKMQSQSSWIASQLGSM
ncbi:flagellar filament capping protein FliD [Anaerophilus nitritogenes]|uniref:flagellar filament capping protein FliD n=1 Tax=Anaerophilus nitritogenes TaxID=2498136 RepID=UPI00101BD65F|nr:flagellar filament capping protein FliD [Anaerophilus nitritogenes]